MSRLRLSFLVLALAALALLTMQYLARVPPPRPGPPNILVLFVDDMGYADLGVTGNTLCPTPSMDSIAQNGVLFLNGYSTACVCSPSRAALLTGRYQQRFGFDANTGVSLTPDPIEALDPSVPTFAERFKELGYATGLVGKWHLGSVLPEQRPNARGFDEFYGLLPHGLDWLPSSVPMWRNHEPVPIPENHTLAFGQEARAFIQRHAEVPWFLYCAFTAVHAPFEAPEATRKHFSKLGAGPRAGYLALLACLDQAIGGILDTLHDNGLDENTLIFLASDNGGEAPAGDNGSFRGGKWNLTEGGIRAPNLIQWKGHIPGGTVRSELVTQLDWLPTALAAAGVPIQPEWRLDGANLLPLLTGETELPPHQALFWRFGVQHAVREKNWKLVRVGGAEAASLYDLERDPGELHDLSSNEPDQVRRLDELWRAWDAQNIAPRWFDERWNRAPEAIPVSATAAPAASAK